MDAPLSPPPVSVSDADADADAGEDLRLPGWIAASGRAEAAPGDADFRAGAALARLDAVAVGARGDVPLPLLRDRLAMHAAVAGLALLGRPETGAVLRDEVYALRPGERPGPGGAVLERWRRAAAPSPRRRGRGQAGATPPGIAAATLERALEAAPRDPAGAVLAADLALSAALRWPGAMPLLGLALRRSDLRAGGAALHDACARAIVRGAGLALRHAAEAARDRARLLAVAPRLRARGSDAALGLFLAQAVSVPARDLSPRIRGTGAAMTDRAARRLCERLVALGAARELTGRSWSRMYGL